MDEREWLVERFEEHRPHLRAVAYRMLGSLAEADEAVQDAWVRVSRAGADGVENLRAWLTTIVARVCLNALRARKARPEDAVGVHLPDPIVMRPDEHDIETEVLMADSVGLALQVVLDTLTPAERLAFVLHDIFDVPFDEIGPMVGPLGGGGRRETMSSGKRVVNSCRSGVPLSTGSAKSIFTSSGGGMPPEASGASVAASCSKQRKYWSPCGS